MVHIFEPWTEDSFVTDKFLAAEKEYKLADDTERYIFSRLLEVIDEVIDGDLECVQYLACLYDRVLADKSISAEDRSLLKMLDKMEEDLMFQPKAFMKRAAFSISFLEADILLHTNFGMDQTRDKKLLGRIHNIRNNWMKEKEKDQQKQEYKDKLKPASIKRYLDDYVIGQEEAKKVVSTAVYGHMKRIWHPEIKFASNVVLLIGPSGCGKTEIMRRIREITELPMVFTDVSSLGASQFRGRHKEDVLLSLWEKAGRDTKLAEKGIIFMDEFDKLLLPAISERGVDMHDDVQSQLLTMLEGSDIELKSEGENFYLNTSGMLFILAGAFQGIEEFIKEDKNRRENIAGNIGFMSTPTKDMDLSISKENINHDVLIKYGMKRELAGRIGSIAVLDKLDRESILRIMTDTKDSIVGRYAREFKISSGARLEFTDEALELIADRVMDETTGARALFRIIRDILRDSLYEMPGRSDVNVIRVTKESVLGETLPECF